MITFHTCMHRYIDVILRSYMCLALGLLKMWVRIRLGSLSQADDNPVKNSSEGITTYFQCT